MRPTSDVERSPIESEVEKLSNTVAVVYYFETKEVISVTIGGEGPPAMDPGQECILVAKEFYDRFPSEDDFLAAVMAEYWVPIDQGGIDSGIPSGGETIPTDGGVPIGENGDNVQRKQSNPIDIPEGIDPSN